uniref:Phage tail protein n=1 Tax=biofilter metagenome TaxID=1070537 RepID=A0A1A7GE56_9ZZZZ
MATRPYNTTAAAGTRFGIVGGVPATFDAAGFSALIFIDIGKIKNGGEIGKQFEIIRNNYLSQRGTEKRKGTFDAGSLTLEVDVKTDAGQAMCETALESDDDYNFQIKFKTGLTYYVRGLVTGFKKKVGGPNDMFAATITVELNPFVDEADVEQAALKVEPTDP